MGTSGLVEWLFSEAGAGWVFGVISLIALLASALTRKRAPKIVFKEVSKQSLGAGSSREKDRIAIAFDDQPVEKLSRLRADIFNRGPKVVKDAIIKIAVPDTAKLLDVSIDGEFGNQLPCTEVETHRISLRIPFLNPVKPHSHIAKVVLFVDGSLDDLQVIGSGEGWSLEHDKSMTAPKTLRRRMLVYFVCVVLLIPSSMVYQYFIQTSVGIGRWEFSWRRLLAAIPELLVAGGFLTWGVKWGLLPSGRQSITALRYLVTGKRKYD